MLVLPVSHQGLARVETRQLDVADLESNRAAAGEPRVDEIAHHLLLAVDRDRPAAGEVGQRDAVAPPVEAQQDAVVHEPLAREPLADADVAQQIDGALLQHARAHSLLHVRAAAILEDDRLDAYPVEQPRQHQARGPRADDRDLGLHRQPRSGGDRLGGVAACAVVVAVVVAVFSSAATSFRTRCATAKALLAAGTPA